MIEMPRSSEPMAKSLPPPQPATFHHRRLGVGERLGLAVSAVAGFFLRDVIVVLTAVIVTVAFSALLTASFQLIALARPAKSTYAVKPSDFKREYRPVALASADGTPLAAWFLPAKVATQQAILVMHGYGSNKSEMLPRVSFLADRYNLLFLDLRYFGESGGDYTTLGEREQDDAAAALAWLRAQGYDRLGAYGFSLGGTVALTTLAADPAVRCAVAESPYGNARLIITNAYRSFSLLREPLADMTVWLAARLGHDLSASHLSRGLKPIRQPVLVIASRTDSVVPTGHTGAVKAGLSANPQAAYLEFDGQRHGEIPPGFGERLFAFFNGCL